MILLVFTIALPEKAQASWGLEKLLKLRSQQSTTNQNDTIKDAQDTEDKKDTQPVNNNDMWAPSIDNEDEIAETTDLTMNSEEVLMLDLINQERIKNGLKPLQPMEELNKLARLKSQDIIENNYFSHTSPTYGSFSKMIYDAGIRYYSAGENLAKARNAKHAHVLLMASSGHKKNILSSNFTHVGIGVVKYKYGVVVTQMFIMK